MSEELPEESFEPEEDRPRRSPEHWVVLAGSVAAFVGTFLLGVLVDPDPRGYGTHEALGLAPCLFVELWDLPCPGCGVTTAVTHAGRGELVASFLTQPFGCALAVGAMVMGVWAPWVHLRGGDLGFELQKLLVGRGARWGTWLGVLVIGAWVYKAWSMRS